MSDYFRVGQFTHKTIDVSKIQQATLEQIEQAKTGDIVGRWNYISEYHEEKMIRPSELERLRRQGDDLADRVVKALDLKRGQDSLVVIKTYLANTAVEDRDPSVVQFWDEMISLPPFFDFQTSEKPIFTPDRAIKGMNRFATPSITEGQAVYWRYAAEISASLLHFSLTVGFSASRITNALNETGYLTSTEKNTTYRRLLETAQMINDSMHNLEPETSVGWQSCLRVRLLHAQTRLKIMEKRGKYNIYDPEVDGIPINQEDLLATLGSFCIAPIWSLRRLNLNLTPQEEMSLVLIWKHIGYYMGIDVNLLNKYYSDLDAAEKSFASCAFHLFSDLQPVADPKTSHSYKMLLSVAGRPPSYTPVESFCELSEIFMGFELARYLGLPRDATRLQRIRVRASLAAGRALILFGRYYPRRAWEYERLIVTKMLVRMVVTWQLGEKRTLYTFKHEEDFGKTLEEIGSAEQPDFEMSREIGKSMQRRWRFLLLEMAAVCGASFCCLGYLGWRSWYAYR